MFHIMKTQSLEVKHLPVLLLLLTLRQPVSGRNYHKFEYVCYNRQYLPCMFVS